MVEEQIRDGIASIRRGVDLLLAAELSRLPASEVAKLLRDFETERRRQAAVDHRLLAEVEQRGIAGEFGRSGAAELLMTMLRVAPAEARARVRQADALQPTQLPSGEVTAAVLPLCADAVAAGEISTAHVTVIAKAIDRIPAGIAYEAAPVAEAMLVEAARHQHSGALGQTAALLLARLDPDGVEPREDELQRRRDFALCRRGDGFTRARGEWTPELAAVWQAILESLAAPQPAADGLPDDRSPGQRRHDAMLEAGLRLLRSGTLPAAGGSPITVVLRVNAGNPEDDQPGPDQAGPERPSGRHTHPGEFASPHQLAQPLPRTGSRDTQPGERGGFAQTSTGEIWPLRRLRANLGDIAVVPVLIDHDGAALMCGRTQRFATRAQRLALAARDGGCCFPGCERPAAWCQVHHVIEWRLGGPTDITNLCLLCTYHHREFERRGWHVRMRRGAPEWLPPTWIDPHQRPLSNSAHHPPEITFGKAG